MNIHRIHHIAIICSDYQRSKNFYVNILGFKIVREAYRNDRDSYKLDLHVGEIQIELFSFPKSPKRLSRPEATGLRHLAFEVHNLEQTIEDLRKHDVTPEPIRIDEYTGKKFTFFNDPDDLPLELYER